MATDGLSDFKLGIGDEFKADRDCAASGCLELQCVRNCHVFSKITQSSAELLRFNLWPIWALSTVLDLTGSGFLLFRGLWDPIIYPCMYPIWCKYLDLRPRCATPRNAEISWWGLICTSVPDLLSEPIMHRPTRFHHSRHCMAES